MRDEKKRNENERKFDTWDDYLMAVAAIFMEFRGAMGGQPDTSKK